MADARKQKTDARIKDAMLALLGTKNLSAITMAEIASQAHVSRSTLYAHFENVSSIFEALVGDFANDVSGLTTQLKCGSCHVEDTKMPFCQAVRSANKYRALVSAPEFLQSYLAYLLEDYRLDVALKPYLETGLTKTQATSLFTFQMTGCYIAATTTQASSWEDSQAAIDQFIRGGMNALRQRM